MCPGVNIAALQKEPKFQLVSVSSWQEGAPGVCVVDSVMDSPKPPHRYNSALLPEKGNILNYWIRISKPVFRPGPAAFPGESGSPGLPDLGGRGAQILG